MRIATPINRTREAARTVRTVPARFSVNRQRSSTARKMERDFRGAPGLGAFWEQADFDGSGEHPLERELCEHLDALARYGRLIADAQVTGRDYAIDILLRQHEREEEQVRRIRAALEWMRNDSEEPGPDGAANSPPPD